MGISISPDDKDLLWLERIVVDRDKDDALKFVEMIKKLIGDQKEHKYGLRI